MKPFKIGKYVGSCTYVYWSIMQAVLPDKVRRRVCILEGSYVDFDYIKYDKKTDNLTLVWVDDFHGNPEPVLTKTITFDNKMVFGKRREYPNNPPVLHGKHLLCSEGMRKDPPFVLAKERFDKLQAAGLTKEEKSKIGRQDYWNSNKSRWGL
jgi:hypothetical protein